MMRALGEFLAVFWVLGLIVGLGGFIHLLGIAAVFLFVLDLVLPHSPETSRARRESIVS